MLAPRADSIILLQSMSRYTNKSSANHSTSFNSKPEPTAPTVHIAINRLKFEQDKLLE